MTRTMRDRRPAVLRVPLAAAALLLVTSVGPSAPSLGVSVAAPPPAAEPASPAAGAATGTVTAHDGHFWRNGSPIVLRGVNVEAREYLSDEDAQRIAGWGMNVIRLRIHWADIEPQAPVPGTWTHTYDANAIARIRLFVDRAWAAGIYTILDNHNCGNCTFFEYPAWTASAAYNSKATTYPATAAGLKAYNTDFWSDALRQQFMSAAMNYVARQFASSPGVIGYQTLNEPQQGNLPSSRATTATVLNVQLKVAQAIRQGDAKRIVLFQTRYGYGPGLADADLSGWTALGNVAFDLHDGFGARWGQGILTDPSSPEFRQTLPPLNNNVVSSGVPPYIGNTVVQARILKDRIGSLQRWGIPLFVGEFGQSADDAGHMLNWGTILGALCYVGGINASWTARDYEGIRGLILTDGSVAPWTPMVVAQAKNPC